MGYDINGHYSVMFGAVQQEYPIPMAGTSRTAQDIVDYLVGRLTEERIRQGCSKRKLAQMASISHGGLSFIENGERRPTLEILLQIAGALEVDLPALLAEALRQVR